MLKATLILAGLLLAVLFLEPGPAECQDGCPTNACNDELPCAGASCGCVVRPGQPWGRCVPY